ncbi:FecR family protein [Sphingobacterium bambusae]|uniref:FecR family protein n=1 Tax=Sphingobacterium bambusae TaxID=662858 RepID=A0ABW6BFN7_9SPHI|nr:FecR domain-containing protein [Sphingobacterium bambusae]WPL47012.1 DUF4974 domain-containing protein [Sphingobacterium bambusae]
MDQKYDAAYIEALAYKLKSGTISDEELAYFNAWYAEQQRQDFPVSPDVARDREELGARIYRHIDQEIATSEQKSTRLFLWKRWTIAAAVILIVGFAGVRYLLPSQQANQVASEAISPASNTAILTLADGSIIQLAEIAAGTVLHTAAADIIKTADGELVYQVKETQGDGEALEYNSITAPAAGKWLVVLPDQSKAWLNASSTISYPTRFAKHERVVKIQGEVYFSVSHQEQVPFYVDCQQQRIRVLGTEFNVEAYGSEEPIKTTLVKGSVAIQTGRQQLQLQPGEQAICSGTALHKEAVDVDAAIAWKNGYFNFNNESLAHVLTKVARWYDVDIVYQTASASNVVLTGKVSNKKNLQSILRFIEYASNIKCTIEGRKVIVSP